MALASPINDIYQEGRTAPHCQYQLITGERTLYLPWNYQTGSDPGGRAIPPS